MQVKNYIHRILNKDSFEQLDMPFYYLPDDFDLPCYRFYIPEVGYDAEEVDAAFYVDVLVDENNVIQQILRYEDEMAFTNYECKQFPNAIEQNAQQLMDNIVMPVNE